jgi:hypothetical protein
MLLLREARSLCTRLQTEVIHHPRPCARQANMEEEEPAIVRQAVDERNPQQKAMDWLLGVANKDDAVKDIIMQELWKREDFQNA